MLVTPCAAHVKEYFYGKGASQPNEDGGSSNTKALSPSNLVVDFSEINVWRAVSLDGLAATSAALPVGHTRSTNDLRVEKVTSAQ